MVMTLRAEWLSEGGHMASHQAKASLDVSGQEARIDA